MKSKMLTLSLLLSFTLIHAPQAFAQKSVSAASSFNIPGTPTDVGPDWSSQQIPGGGTLLPPRNEEEHAMFDSPGILVAVKGSRTIALLFRKEENRTGLNQVAQDLVSDDAAVRNQGIKNLNKKRGDLVGVYVGDLYADGTNHLIRTGAGDAIKYIKGSKTVLGRSGAGKISAKEDHTLAFNSLAADGAGPYAGKLAQTQGSILVATHAAADGDWLAVGLYNHSFKSLLYITFQNGAPHSGRYWQGEEDVIDLVKKHGVQLNAVHFGRLK